jgi:hypothetical protein
MLLLLMSQQWWHLAAKQSEETHTRTRSLHHTHDLRPTMALQSLPHIPSHIAFPRQLTHGSDGMIGRQRIAHHPQVARVGVCILMRAEKVENGCETCEVRVIPLSVEQLDIVASIVECAALSDAAMSERVVAVGGIDVAFFFGHGHP